MRLYVNGTEATALVTGLELDRSLEMAGAELRVTAVYAPEDRFLPKLNPAWGEAVVLEHEGATLFSGYAERVSFDSDSLLLTLVCLERSALLAQNEYYGTLSGPPALAAATLILAAGLRPGALWSRGGSVLIAPSCGRSCLAGIRAAYGGDCFTEERNGAVDVLRPGCRSYTLRTEGLLSLRAVNTLEPLVTGAEVRGGSGALLASRYDALWERSYGRRRRVYALDGAQSGAEAQARAALSRARRQAEAVMAGDPAARCGARMTLEQGAFGASGRYLVRRVLHRVSDGVFLTTLGLETE